MKKNKNVIIIVLIAFILILVAGGIILYQNSQIKKEKQAVAYLFSENKSEVVKAGTATFQKEVDNKIKGYLLNDNYTVTNPMVMVNPYGISPLSALLVFRTKDALEITIEVQGQKMTYPSSKSHALPVYGLMSDMEQKVIITASDKTKHEVLIKTEKVDPRYKSMSIITENKNSDGYYFVTSPLEDSAVAYDGEGKVRWYLTSNYHNDLQLLKNGHILLSSKETSDNMASTTGFVEMDYLGKIYNEYIVQGGYHHDIEEMANGDFLVLSSNYETSRSFDYITLIDRTTGKLKETWDLFDIVSKIDEEFAKTLPNTWAWINSVFYDTKKDELVLSLRNRNSVIGIGYKDKKLKWLFGDIKDWSKAFTPYLLKGDESVRYPLGQHSAFIDEDGRLGIFNNGYDAHNDDKIIKCSDLKDNYSSVGLYEIKDQTIKQVYNYDHNKELFSYALSNFNLQKDKSKLINFGWEFSEKDYNDKVCTQLTNNNVSSRLIELDKNDKVVFEATIPQGKYRVKKLNIYDNITTNYNTDTYKKHQDRSTSKVEKIKAYSVQDKLKNAKEMLFSLDITSNNLKTTALLPNDMEAKIAFINKQGEIAIYLLKEKNKDILPLLYLEEMKGDYALFLILNGEYKNIKQIVKF